ncbi:MAG: hypothetical protein PVF58_07890 [Candidatus Methanofastidiosia archaeon]|jgi:hypothetical protein
MFKAIFTFVGFGLAALGIWLGNPVIAIIGVLSLAFVIWWMRSTRPG